MKKDDKYEIQELEKALKQHESDIDKFIDSIFEFDGSEKHEATNHNEHPPPERNTITVGNKRLDMICDKTKSVFQDQWNNEQQF